jgi:membrane protein YqaA with SNARE-associated domain
MAEDLVVQFGYIGLFIISFLAATVIPFSTEVAVLLMPRIGFNVWIVMGVATAGNFLGSMTGYVAGRLGSDWVFSRFFDVKPERYERVERWVQKYGAPALGLNFLPFVGDVLPVVAGTMSLGPWVTSAWVFAGKFLRYVVLLGIAGYLW